MFVNIRTVALALFVAATVVRAADDPATNGTSADAPGAPGNGTAADAPSNGTSADAPPAATNGTIADNSTSPAAPQPSGGATGSNSRRALQACEWACPARTEVVVDFEMAMGGTFACTYADHVTCVYQKTTGVLSGNDGDSECPNAATALTAGCVPGQSTNGGLLNLVRRKIRRTSRDIQRSAMKRRNML